MTSNRRTTAQRGPRKSPLRLAADPTPVISPQSPWPPGGILQADCSPREMEVTGGGRARDFERARDHAMIRMLAEGVRRMELVQQQIDDLPVDLIAPELHPRLQTCRSEHVTRVSAPHTRPAAIRPLPGRPYISGLAARSSPVRHVACLFQRVRRACPSDPVQDVGMQAYPRSPDIRFTPRR